MHLGSGPLGRSGESFAHPCGVDGAVRGAVQRAVDVVNVHQRVQLLRLGRA